MGLTGSSAKLISGTATSFSFAGSSIESFTTAYLFSDASKSVNKIVRESRQAFMASVQQNDMTTLDYPNAVTLLTGYEAVCRPAQIRALIDDAVAKGTVVAETAGSKQVDSEVGNLLNTLTSIFRRPVTEVEAINLYAWYKYPGQRNSGAKTEVNEPIRSLKLAGDTDATLQQKLSQAFLNTQLIGSTIPGRWAAAVEQIVSVGTSGVPAATASISRGITSSNINNANPIIRVPVLTIK